MDFQEFQRLVEEAKSAYETETATLRERIAKARQSIERNEAKLAAIQETYGQRVAEITRAYTGLEPLPAAGQEDRSGAAYPGPTVPAAEPRTRRGSLDQPLLKLVQEIAKPDCTVADVTDAWRVRHPGEDVKRSTVRGILERLVKKEKLAITEQGGRGSANPRRYAVRIRPNVVQILEISDEETGGEDQETTHQEDGPLF